MWHCTIIFLYLYERWSSYFDDFYYWHCGNYFQQMNNKQLRMTDNHEFFRSHVTEWIFAIFIAATQDAIVRDFTETLKTRSFAWQREDWIRENRRKLRLFKNLAVTRVILQFPLQSGTLWWEWKKNYIWHVAAASLYAAFEINSDSYEITRSACPCLTVHWLAPLWLSNIHASLKFYRSNVTSFETFI